MSDMRTPLGKVRGLGSAREGTEHFWRQRLTADRQRAADPVLRRFPRSRSTAPAMPTCAPRCPTPSWRW